MHPSITDFFIRESPTKMVIHAAERLPQGYYFRIFDAWRSLELQKSLYYSK
jgi:hypothetical protein